MRRRLGLLPVALLGLLLLGAAPDANVERLLRDGNAAFDRGDYEQAVEFYSQAEDRTTDPGQVAYNKATALYRLALAEKEEGSGDPASRFRQAEDYYRRGAEGADEPRRSRALFGLANSLVQGRSAEARSLLQAVRCYRECLRSPDPQIAEDARHNLELAKLLWLRVRAKDARQSENENKNPQDSNPENNPPMNDQNPGRTGGEPGKGRPGATEVPQAIPGGGENAMETNQHTPGPSNEPPLRDDDKLSPRTEKEAEEDLAKAVKQILTARKAQRLRPPPSASKTVKDW
jgi:tetratricopeptide (TPR) repeat protein